MRLLPAILLALLFWPAHALADAYSARILTDAPRNYWRMNDLTGSTTLDDIGINNDDLTLHGGYTLEQQGHLAVMGKAVDWNGTSGYADNTHNYTGTGPWNPNNATTMTLEAWVYIQAAVRIILSHGIDGAATAHYGWWFYINTGPKVSYISFTDAGATHMSITGATTLATDTWYMVHAIHAGNTATGGSEIVKVFVNCVQDGSSTTISNTPRGGANAGIAVAANEGAVSWANFFDGKIQEVAVYVEEITTPLDGLSTDTMCAHYLAGVGGEPIWPWTAKAPKLPRFFNGDYLAKLVSRGYVSGNLSVRTKEPPQIPLAWLPFGVLPAGNVR